MSDQPVDYTFMKSGFNNLRESSSPDEETILTITSMVTAFMDNALHTASVYVEHANRKTITKEDIILCLKSETFKFLQRPDIGKDVQKWREIILEEQKNRDEHEDASDDDSESDYNELEEDEKLEPFTPSECRCEICKDINDIDLKWSSWVPNTDLEKILKRVIDTKF